MMNDILKKSVSAFRTSCAGYGRPGEKDTVPGAVQTVAEEWETLRNKLAAYNAHWDDGELDELSCSNLMVRTALMGNGDLGANSAGSNLEKSYRISKGDFWNCGDLQTLDTVHANPRRNSHLSVGGITLQAAGQPNSARNTEFHEELDIATGVLTTNMRMDGVPLVLRSWISPFRNIMITEVVSRGTAPVSLECAVWTRSDLEDYFPREAGVVGETVWASKKTENFVQDENPVSWKSEVVINTKLLGAEAETKRNSHENASLFFTLQPGQTVFLLTAVGGGGKNYDWHGNLQTISPLEEAQNLLNLGCNAEILAKWKAENDLWWKNYWLRSYVDVGDELLHRYYYGSLYYMACTSREGCLPPGLYGIWATTDRSMWSNDYHMNYNFMAPFYGMYSSNRCEFAKSLKDPLLDYMDEGMERAKHLEKVVPAYIYGGLQPMQTEHPQCEGQYIRHWKDGTFSGRPDLLHGIEDAVIYPVALGPWGTECWNDEGGGYYSQVTDAGFTAMALTAYYRYTKDAAYLREIYPFLEKNMNFYVKWCEKEELEDGSYRYNIWSGAHEGSFERNHGTALSVIRNMTECIFEGTEDGAIQPPAEKLAVWKDLHDHLAAVPVVPNFAPLHYEKPVMVLGEYGLQYWTGAADVGLEMIIPCEQVSFDSDPALMEAIQNAVEMRGQHTPDTWFQTNSLPKLCPNAIRGGCDPHFILEKFKMVLNRDLEENYTMDDPYHGIEKAGALSFINGMLLQGDHGIMKVFPSWIGTDASFTRLREHGAFLISSAMRNGRVTGIEIHSEAGGQAIVVNPWKHAAVVDADGNPVKFAVGKTRYTNEETIILDTRAGDTFTVVEYEETAAAE